MIRALALAVLAAVLAAGAAEAGELTVDATGARPNVGAIHGSVFTSEASYMTSSAMVARAEVGPDGGARLVFGEIPAGPIAVVLTYDENGDGEMNTSLLGVPTEAFGFSNGAKAFLGPPDWDAARIRMPKDDLTLEIALDRAD